MAARTATKIGERQPVGTVFEQIYSVQTSAAGQTDEWFVTDFSFVESVSGFAVQGNTAVFVAVVLREQGTSGSETADDTVVGFETGTAGTPFIHFTVRGRA